MSKNNQKKKIIPTAGKSPAKDKPEPKSGIANWIWLCGILVLTFIVFFPAINNALTNWDDPRYINDNPLIRNLSMANIRKIFSEPYFGNYQPLHILSYAIEYHFYKLNPVGYHAASVIMHLIATALVFRFVFLLSGNSLITIITALLFGIHPLHVESVAWAAERKDLLYTIFFIGSLILYIQYVQKGEKLKYLFYAFILFALSIMSKAMASSLPPVLILIDFYMGRKFNRKIVFEKIPFFALAIVFGLISAITASTTGQVSLNVFSLFERIMIANFNLLAYTFKLILPINLSAFYPYPQKVDGHLPYYFFIAPVIIAGLMILIIRSLKKSKAVFFGAGFFVACIFLVLQLLPVGPTIMSERYSYLSSVGFFFTAGYFISLLVKNKPSLKTVVFTVFTGYCLFLSAATYKRCDVWKDSLTLWTDVLDQFPHVGTALNNRGNIYGKERGDLDRAMEEFNKSIQFDPGYENAYANRGIVYCMRGKFDLGIQDFNKAIQLKPGYYDAIINRGIAYCETKQYDKSIDDFNSMMADNPEDPLLFSHRGWALLMSGKNEEALNDFNRSISLDPNSAQVYMRRSNALYNLKQYKEAYNDIQRASSMGLNIDKNYIESLKKAAEAVN